jgi:chemotaxis protein CheD
LKRRHSLVPLPSRPPPALRGFTHINRYFDVTLRRWVAQVLPGEFYVTRQDEVIATVLGSCVATCVRDHEAGVGGINHFMLPNGDGATARDALRYGSHAVARLLGELAKYGARPERLEIKMFGGGRVIDSAADIGEQNVSYARQYFDGAALAIAVEDTRGSVARRVRYFPATGKALVQHFETRDPSKLNEEPPSLQMASETRMRSAALMFGSEGESRGDTRVDSRRLGAGSEATHRAHLSGLGLQRRRRGP